MSLVDALNDEEDRTREQKLQKESEKTHFFKEKEQKKKAQKQKKVDLRSQALKEIEEKQKSENAPAKVSILLFTLFLLPSRLYFSFLPIYFLLFVLRLSFCLFLDSHSA